MIRILVLEDERNVGSTLVERFRRDYEVAWATSCEEARQEIAMRKFDLALLDVGLPDGSGFEIAELLRKSQPSAAIVFLTAFGDPDQRIRGLELGAEDYVVKPFHLKELILRVQNALKRAQYLAASTELVRVGRASVDFSKYQATLDGGEIVTLTHKETALLKFLIDRKGSVVSRDEILNHVWSEDEFPSARTVDNFIMRLRRIVEPDPESPIHIRSVRGVGYQLSN